MSVFDNNCGVFALGVLVYDVLYFLFALRTFALGFVDPCVDALKAVNMITTIQRSEQLGLWLLHTYSTSLQLFCLVHFGKRLSTRSDLLTQRNSLFSVVKTFVAAKAQVMLRSVLAFLLTSWIDL